MAVTAARSISIVYSGDISGTEAVAAASNAASPGTLQLVRLAIGDNTITPPGAGSTLAGVTIIPPSGNTNALKIKGVGADTGITIHKTDPTSLGLDSATANFVINAAAQTDVRLLWT